MTWTKLGDEFSDEARDLSDAAYRTHVDALCWSNRRQLDLAIPKRDLRRFGETDDPDTAAKELVHGGWWEDRGDAWWIGCRFADWQQESVVIAKRREQSATTTRRSRLHKAGDHSLCLAKHCTALVGDASQDMSRDLSPGTGRYGAVRGSSKSSSGAAPTPEGLGGQGQGEGGVGGEPLLIPDQCSRHQDGPHDDPCRACGRAREAHKERQVADAAKAHEEASRPQELCDFHRLPIPCRGCRSDELAGDAR